MEPQDTSDSLINLPPSLINNTALIFTASVAKNATPFK